MPEIIQNRYVVGEVLGVGAMGTVHRAIDRLTGQTVALKRLTASVGDIRFATRILESEKSATEVRLTMTREFQALAALRHPNIITVLDYGFEEGGRPFFTMELLRGAANILEAGQGRPLQDQIKLLIQVLDALAYLHRRGILHRDLKPDNVLVVEGSVRLLDFGLAASVDSGVQGIAGTLAYIAPEVLDGEPPGFHSDLYAIGMIAYEMLVGKHPFRLNSAAALIEDILDTVPDPRAAGLSEPLAQVLSRLLAKTPAARYPDATSVISELCRAVGLPLPAETKAVREGFLQSARFVGRTKEIDELLTRLRKAKKGTGSACLILGESGVGKSRLVSELAIRAVVENVLTLRVQCKPDSGPRLGEWDQAIRQLALLFPESDTSASLLSIVTPDPRPNAAEPPAPPNEQHGSVVLGALLAANRPILLVIEDAQWATDEMELARLLCNEAPTFSLMVGVTARTEDSAKVVERLQGVPIMRLERFKADEIAELSFNMIGTSARQPQVQALLQRQTEGNAYFLVEVVRVLAEEAGSLANVGMVTLPEAVFSEGVRSVIRRRLARLLPEDRALLWTAAVAGRVLDLAALRSMAEATGAAVSFDDWLCRCADAAVIEAANGGWQFTHDTLREAVLADIPPEERIALHRKIAETLERLYGEDPARSRELAFHWRQAGDERREQRHALQVARAAAAADSFQEAIGLLERALYLTPAEDTATRTAIALEFGTAYAELGDYLAATAYLEQAITLASALNDPMTTARALLMLGEIAIRQGQGGVGRHMLLQALQLNAGSSDRLTRTRLYSALGALYLSENDLSGAENAFREGLAAARAAGLTTYEATLLTQLGSARGKQGDYEDGLKLWRETVAVGHQPPSVAQEATLLATMGLTAWLRGDLQTGRRYTEEALTLEQQLGRRYNIATCLITLGHIYTSERQFAEATSAFQRALTALTGLDMPALVLEVLSGLALLYIAFGQYSPAAELLGLIIHHPAVSTETLANSQTMWERLQRASADEGIAAENIYLLHKAFEEGRRNDLRTVVYLLVHRLRTIKETRG